MSTFVASDLHLNHLSIPVYCAESRGHITPEWVWNEERNQKWPTIETIRNMNEIIISNWNEMISDDDEVYILGDVAMGLIEKAPGLIKRLNGEKFLIRGNHDKSLVKLIDKNPVYNNLFSWIKDYYELYFGEYLICMSHYPIASWNRKGKKGIHLHGHLHGNKSGIDGWIKDVGIDTNQLKPYLLDDVVKEIIKLPEGAYRHD